MVQVELTKPGRTQPNKKNRVTHFQKTENDAFSLDRRQSANSGSRWCCDRVSLPARCTGRVSREEPGGSSRLRVRLFLRRFGVQMLPSCERGECPGYYSERHRLSEQVSLVVKAPRCRREVPCFVIVTVLHDGDIRFSIDNIDSSQSILLRCRCCRWKSHLSLFRISGLATSSGMSETPDIPKTIDIIDSRTSRAAECRWCRRILASCLLLTLLRDGDAARDRRPGIQRSPFWPTTPTSDSRWRGSRRRCESPITPCAW